ncbi:TBC1 domain family member 23-like [Clavelina lepadiformis]|uniref:TBC1 domain family member 23-like n=1 Tax=Clavelina lepadiformis TaxID=159417 RepID=UPI0040418095
MYGLCSDSLPNMAEPDHNNEPQSPPSEFEEVNASDSNYSEAEIIDSDWHFELENVLNEGFVDQGIIKSVCKCRNLPEKFRSRVWKICLNVANRGNSMSSWDGKLDLLTDDDLRADCTAAVESTFDEEMHNIVAKGQMIDDLVAVVTYYCKCRAVKYHTNNGWMDILRPLVKLQLERSDLYNCFYALQSRYIPRTDLSPQVSSMPFHLLRLLLLYHDPEMCNFLDTCKISMESFTNKWFSTLFSTQCSIEIASAIWDIYLQQADPFFVFYLSLVILVNAKEQVMTTVGANKLNQEETITTLENSPSVLSIEDVDDFCQLATYYCNRTPSSFKRDLGGCFYSGAMVATSSKVDFMASDLAQSFCLKVSIPELLLSSQPSSEDASDDDNGPRIRFFVVDCRPAEKYNKGHLLTAFHLDATLMLREPTEFDAALTSLFAAQEQAIQAGSTAGGEHLCFIGSGTDDEDQYMYMVVANLLQKHQTYVSVARGGYASLLDYLTEVGIDLSEWIVGAECPVVSQKKGNQLQPDQQHAVTKRAIMGALMKKVAGNVVERTMHLKEKVSHFIETTDEEWSGERKGKYKGNNAQKGADGVFSIGDENEHDDEDVAREDQEVTYNTSEIDDLDVWKSKPDVKYCFECQSVSEDRRLVSAHLLVTTTEMRCLVEVKPRKGRRLTKQIFVKARPPRLLCTVIKITSRKSFPELITFKFGDLEQMESDEEARVVAADRYILPDAGGTTRSIKQLIVEADVKRQEDREKKTSSNDSKDEDQPSTSKENT